MDEGKQPLSEAEQQQLEAEQAVQAAEAQTGKEAVPRTMATEDPVHLDPRFDKDDLRQGKPPPAVKKRKHLRIRRKRKAKGTPLSQSERRKALGTTAAADAAAADKAEAADGNETDEGSMTEEEVDLTEDEGMAVAMGYKSSSSDDKKGGLVSKILGKN